MATNPIDSRASWGWPDRGDVMSEEGFHKLEDLKPDRKFEYISGIAYVMSGVSVGHDRITHNIGFLLNQCLSVPCTSFGSSVQVLLAETKNAKKHFVYPDATVSCSATDRRSDNLLIESPKVVVEVLSPGTETKDRGVKFKAYQNCPTVQEIVLVNQFAQYIEIWQRDELDTTQWHYRHYSPGETVAFASIDFHVAIEDLYRGLDFTLATEDEE